MTPATKAPPRPRTAAARKQTATRPASRRASGRQSVRPHRRVSGPATPPSARSATARAATARAVAAPLPVPPLGAISLRVLRAGRSLQDSTLLDRLVRGRGWIGLLAVLLFGLVALNVSLLKLNAAAGHNAEQAKTLRIQNAKLRGKVSRLASGDRIRAAAGDLGLVMPEPKKIHYLNVRDRDGRQAARNIRDGTAFALTDDLVSATPEVDQELLSPTPPAGALEAAAQAQAEAQAPAGTATTEAPAAGAAAGQVATAPVPQQTAPAGG